MVDGVHYQRQGLQSLAIDLKLAGKTSQCVVGAFYLVAVDVAANDGNVDAPPSVDKAEFIEDKDIVPSREPAKITLA